MLAGGCHFLAIAFTLRCRRRIPSGVFSGRLLIRYVAAANCRLLLVLGAADLDALRLRQRCFRNADAENAVLELALDQVLIHALRQLECANESAIGSLDDLIAVVLSFLTLTPLLAADGQHAVLGDDFDVLGLEAGQLDVEADLLFVLFDVDRWRKRAALAREGVFEQPVDFAPESENRGARRHSVKHFRLLVDVVSWVEPRGGKATGVPGRFAKLANGVCQVGRLFVKVAESRTLERTQQGNHR